MLSKILPQRWLSQSCTICCFASGQCLIPRNSPAYGVHISDQQRPIAGEGLHTSNDLSSSPLLVPVVVSHELLQLWEDFGERFVCKNLEDRLDDHDIVESEG